MQNDDTENGRSTGVKDGNFHKASNMARKFSISLDDGTRRRRRHTNKGILGTLYELLGLLVSIKNIFKRSSRFISRAKSATEGASKSGKSTKKTSSAKTTTTAKAAKPKSTTTKKSDS